MTIGLRSAVFACSLALCPAAANATIIQVANPAGMTQGLYSIENFEDSLFVPGVTFSAPSGVRQLSAWAASSSSTSSGLYGLSTNNFPEPLTMTFAVPTSSVGMYFGNDDRCCAEPFTAYLDIFGTAGSLGTISVVANMNDFADQFIGFTSDEVINRVSIRYGSGSNVGLYHFVDDVRFNTASVPEPSTLFLFGLGLLSLAAVRRQQSLLR
ncbi:MAG: PEP-CTERM sorting domain-containing protein, partial [Candidatus Obscuribacterales bacterium]|nr:PEP-CTERM sorting domain-containing protein [Steroidobacteraceae bacterium]